MKKMIVFDMDGTIANLYGVDNWLLMLRAEDTTPYEIAEPLFDMDILATLLECLKAYGWRIAVTTWGAKNGTKEYNARTMKAKRDWLDAYNFPYDEFHGVQYGTTKANCTRNKADFQILVDDNDTIRKGWTLGKAIDPTELLATLIDLLVDEVD